jgi:superfamily I DNA/RNA helicase
VDSETRTALERFIKPLYQDLDGVSRLDEVDRISAIARRLHQPPSPADARRFELLLLTQRLGSWLKRVGNLSRIVLGSAGRVSEQEMRDVASLLQTLDRPSDAGAIALAAAIRIDEAGVRGLATRIAQARREGSSPADVARTEIAEDLPDLEWMPEAAQTWLKQRLERRRAVCRSILEEMSLDDLR